MSDFYLPQTGRAPFVAPVDYPWLLGRQEYKAMPRDAQTLYLALIAEQIEGRIASDTYLELLAQYPKAADYLLEESWIDFVDPKPTSNDFSVMIFLPEMTIEERARVACLAG